MTSLLKRGVASLAIVGAAACSENAAPLPPTAPSAPAPAPAPTPTVRALDPSSGPTVGGDYTRVSGTGFQSGATVTFDGPALPPMELRAGSVARLTAGMRTVWTVHETLRKVYIAG